MNTKRCTICGKEKPLTDFSIRNKQKNTYKSECKQCHNDKVKLRYYYLKDVVNEYKKCGCAKCGENRLYVLDFHHIDPSTKDGTITRMSTKYSLDRLQNEIDKCVVLCANCHREFHYLNLLNNISLKDYLKMSIKKS